MNEESNISDEDMERLAYIYQLMDKGYSFYDAVSLTILWCGTGSDADDEFLGLSEFLEDADEQVASDPQ